MTIGATIQSLSLREAVIDALYRCINGLDLADEQLFRSAFTIDAKLTVQEKTTEGLVAIVADTYKNISKLDTTHHISNIRLNIDGSRAQMTATALAQHYRTGTGMQDVPRLLAGSFWDVDLVQQKDETEWKIKDWKLRLVWSEGDFAVLRS